MRHVGDLPTHDQAQRFADYLLVRDVKVSIDQEDGQWAIWAVEEDETPQVKEELARFRDNPDAEEYRGHGSQAERRRKAEEKANREFRKNQVDVRTRWGRGGAAVISGPITLGLIAISVLVALMTEAGADINKVFLWLTFEKLQPVPGGFLRSGTDAIAAGEVWRLFTPMFIHFGLIHILFNMLWLKQLGSQIESRAGTWKYLLLVFAIAGISNSAEFFWAQYRNEFSIFGGMSGVVYGLFGYIWMKVRFAPQERYLLNQQTVTLMMIWLVLCMTGMVGRIANAAHLIGLLSGVIIGYAGTFLRKDRS